ncbi:MAG TPA: PKD domain-containing protein, partial [Candidatus Thermoplasmatota archaeon]|nr:PKD domain-containing protein [Candidatus Thermoplasmatota archaeon]
QATTLDALGFDASASADADGAVVSWRFTTSDGADTGHQASPAFRHAFARPGAHWVRVDVRDDEGHDGVSATLPIDVANRPPEAILSLSATRLTRLDDLVARSLSRDPDGSLVEQAWSFGDGHEAAGAVATRRYVALGSYEVALRVVDDSGAAAEARATVDVVNAPPAAAFTVSPARVQPGLAATFRSAATDADGAVVGLAWDFGDGTTASGAVVEHVFEAECACVVRLAATDSDGATTVLEKVVQVRLNEPPAPAFAATKGAADNDWTFADQSADADGEVVAWRWEFGDGGVSSERSPRHVYAEAGPMVVTLTVTDDVGASRSASRVVEVDDVLGVRAVARAATPFRPAYLDLAASWANGTAQAVRFDARFERLDPATGTWALVGAFAGESRQDGTVSLRMPYTHGVANAPGQYRAVGEVATASGLGGDVERAAFETPFAVALG